ncbi:MAG: polymer-forming cytoskeletal protein [Anaerolineales bacterium]|nr:polymer-forming cytoskeletal protein [Anaerolineales bacterium]
MKSTRKIILLISLITLISLALPGTALAASPASHPSDLPKELVIGGSYTLESDETLNDDLVIIGGTATLEDNSTLNGNVLLLGGTLDASGTINGDITATGGYIELTDNAVVNGDITTTGAYLDRDPDATVQGNVRDENDGPFNMDVPGMPHIPYVGNVYTNPFMYALSILVRTVLWALIAMLAMMFLAPKAESVSATIISQPLIAGGLGLLTLIIAPLVLVAIGITIILLPVTLVGGILLFAAWAFGMISLGLELGKRFARIFNQEWHPALAAGLGTFLLFLVLNSISAVADCIGWLPQLLAGALGVGAVLLTRFGTAEYNPQPKAPSSVEPLPPPDAEA